MDIATLRQVGEALFGARWQMPLARALVQPDGRIGVDISLMQRWVAGERPLPAWLSGALAGVVRAERIRHLEHVDRLAEIEAWLPQ